MPRDDGDTRLAAMRITVTGTSSIALPAECVAVNFTVGFLGADREPVVADTVALAGSVRARLDGAVAEGVARDLRVTGLRTRTATPFDGHGRQTTQHSAEVRGSVVLVDLERIGPLLGQLAATAGVHITWLDWRLLDATLAEVQPRALADAFGNARRRAEWIAHAAGRSTLEVVAVQDGGGVMPMARQAARSLGLTESAPSIDLDPDDVELSATLTVEFDAS